MPDWAERFIRFCKGPEGFRHPRTPGAAEVEQFLTHLAAERHVSPSTQNQALAALLFLYRDVLHLDLGLSDAARARRSRRGRATKVCLPQRAAPPARKGEGGPRRSATAARGDAPTGSTGILQGGVRRRGRRKAFP
jgi:hypothetical protein